MLTDKDIKKLQSLLPSKKDIKDSFRGVDKHFDDVGARTDRIETVVAGTQQRVEALETQIDRIEVVLEKLVQGVDRLVVEFQELRREYAAMSEQLTRHERWIKQIAKKAGVALVE